MCIVSISKRNKDFQMSEERTDIILDFTPRLSDSETATVTQTDTIVYTLDSCRSVDVKFNDVTNDVAACLLDAKVDRRISTVNPVEMLYVSTNPDLKIYALRNRVMLPENTFLSKYYDIRCRGPVVVTLFTAQKEDDQDRDVVEHDECELSVPIKQSIKPMPIKPMRIKPMPIKPTPIKPTPIKPMPIESSS